MNLITSGSMKLFQLKGKANHLTKSSNQESSEAFRGKNEFHNNRVVLKKRLRVKHLSNVI